jgi:WXG100 family type VII secretion target
MAGEGSSTPSERRRKGFHMATDKVGGSPAAMMQAVTNFNTRYSEFVAASQNITADTLALQAAWTGNGYDAFTGAMGNWNTDINNVTLDLQSMSRAVNSSSDALVQTDTNIARAFNSYK